MICLPSNNKGVPPWELLTPGVRPMAAASRRLAWLETIGRVTVVYIGQNMFVFC